MSPSVPEPVPLPANETEAFRMRLRRSALTLPACALLVTLAYFYVDRPVAFFVHERGLNRVALFDLLTRPAMIFNALAPLVVVYAAVRRAWGPLCRIERVALAAALSLIVAVALEYYLKFLFGRYWPETWVDNNPSLIGTGAYGFHPFHFGEAYGSFPSGHTARVYAVLGVFWLAYPRWRLLWAAGALSVMVGLVGMNYHFVGDTIGGAFLGSLTAMYAARFLATDHFASRGTSSASGEAAR